MKTIPISSIKSRKVKEIRYTTSQEQKYYDIPPTPMIVLEDGSHLFLHSTSQGIFGFKDRKNDNNNSKDNRNTSGTF